MALQKIIVVQEGCPYCPLLIKNLEDNGQIKNVKVIDSSTKVGSDFADSHGIEFIPECLVEDEKGARLCSDQEWSELTKKKENILFKQTFKP